MLCHKYSHNPIENLFSDIKNNFKNVRENKERRNRNYIINMLIKSINDTEKAII